MMSVRIYVDASRPVGDAGHLKVLPIQAPRSHGFERTTRKVSRSNTR